MQLQTAHTNLFDQLVVSMCKLLCVLAQLGERATCSVVRV
jgi:hypothetical protein